MRVLVTGSSGHLGEALMRSSPLDFEMIGADVLPSRFTTHVGSITDRSFVHRVMQGVSTVLHTATLHKPHVATHSRQEFIDTNITGTLNVLEEAVQAKVGVFIYTSTTSVFGDALIPAPGKPAAWITEDVRPIPKNIYGVTKAAAEDLCELFYRNQKLPCLVLRTSRFFPEADDDRRVRQTYSDANVKVNEFLSRRVDLEDVVSAHLLAMEQAARIGFGKYIISATTPFTPADLEELRDKAPQVLERVVPGYAANYARRHWKMFPGIDRVYVNERARRELGWKPRHNFDAVLDRLRADGDWRSDLARQVGAKGYHPEQFADGPFPVETSL
jgi:nucleoside-diphosphate-sugar epimerase